MAAKGGKQRFQKTCSGRNRLTDDRSANIVMLGDPADGEI
jgi:hypothetical protein